MSKRGPTAEEEARELACAFALALGRFSDDKWREGPWFMTLTLVARKLADQLYLGQLDDRVLDILQHHMPWVDGSAKPGDEVEATWTPPATSPPAVSPTSSSTP